MRSNGSKGPPEPKAEEEGGGAWLGHSAADSAAPPRFAGPPPPYRGEETHTTPISLPTLVKAATARSIMSGVWAADIWVRMRALPLGTTG